MENCINCENQLTGNFCATCGKSKSLKRIDKQYVFNEISSVLNFDKGFFYTIKELCLRPGRTVNKFINEDRNRLVKPIVFIIITSLIYSILQQIFHFEDGYIGHSFENKNTTASLLQWVSNNYGYANLIMGIIIAFWLKLFFRKHKYNFFEILILLCFIMGVGMLLFGIFGVADSITSLKIVDKGFFIGIIYIIWAIGQFFGKKWQSYLKVFFAYFIGMLSFFLGIMIIGSIIDNIF